MTAILETCMHQKKTGREDRRSASKAIEIHKDNVSWRQRSKRGLGQRQKRGGHFDSDV